MVEAGKIPENIRQDISIYLGSEEKILKALSLVSGKIEAVGEIWLILTSHSIYFHTRELSKEPVIALLPRNEIKEIDYFQKQYEITLTFFPKKSNANSTRLSFPIDKKGELEDLCDEIADLINFRMETPAGVKVYPKPSELQSKPSEEPKKDIKKAPTSPSSTREIGKSEIKDSKPAQKADPRQSSGATSKVVASSSPKTSVPNVKIVSSTTDEKINCKSGNQEAKYVLIATVVSILVAFIWYQFFKAIGNKTGR